MIRFTWLRFRAQAAVVFGALAVLAVVLAVTGWHLAHLYDTAAATCRARGGDCSAPMSAFANSDSSLQSFVRVLLLVAPALIGMFWGAPLIAREFETGTFRLAWTQDVTPTRWLAIKLGVVGLASVAAAGLLSIMVTWWSSPIDKALMDQWAVFSQRDITPIGYAAFAFAIGATAGLLIRRTVPAMAITLAVFAAVQVVMRLWVRPHLIAPAHTTSALNIASVTATGSNVSGGLFVDATVNTPGSWVNSSQIITPSGHLASTEPATQACAGPNSTFNTCNAYLARLHLRQVVTYQPASRYWAFQWYETAIFLGLAVIMAGVCFWQIRRRRSEELHILHPHASRPARLSWGGAVMGWRTGRAAG